ncbi:MAG: hypothetical protein HY774_11955 [Acidobacteria bacterium]|nr:hypothetical protein [Acidobacteriota bacterium]
MYTTAENQQTSHYQPRQNEAEASQLTGLHQRPQVQAQLQLQQKLDQSPRVTAQTKLAEEITSRSALQRRLSPINAPIQRTLDVDVPYKGRTKYRRKSAIEKNVPHNPYKNIIVNMLYYWAQLNEELSFDSWEDAIQKAMAAIYNLKDHPKFDEISELLEDTEFDKTHIRKLQLLLQQAFESEDLSPTKVEPIDVKKKEKIPVVDIDGNLLEQEDQEEMVHPIFLDLTQGKYNFIIVKLPDEVDEETLQTPVKYKGKKYRIDLMAGSSIKPAKGKSSTVYGIEEGSVEMFKDMFGYEESSYYAQRSLFPLVNAGVTGKIRGRAYPIEKGMEHTFRLKDGTEIQVDDGWGYIKKSLADKMQRGGMQYEKRQPVAQSGKASHQMMEWFDEENIDVINELVQWGLSQWVQGYQEFLQQKHNAGTNEYFQSKRSVMSLLTTGKPPMEMGVAMPVPGKNVVIPKDQTRYTKHLPGEMSLIRSPVDKQNFHPISAKNIEQNTKISKLVGNIEGIQYTLTGRQDELLTFFKGMVGVIDDSLWPIDWKGVDLVVSSKDRKLYEKWVRDTSLEEDAEDVVDRETDRSSMGKAIQDFTIEGTLAAIQWYAKGSFIGVPAKIQKWLGGDYDGDEVAAIFGKTNPQLQAYIRDKAYQELEINPKLQKTFTYNPNSSRAKRMVAMRSPNVGNWSNIAAWVRSLPSELKVWLAEQTADGRLLPDDEELNSLDEPQKMEKEIQLGIKVGTDAYKTSTNVKEFENRARLYLYYLKTKARPIMHNKKLLDVFDKVGVLPTLTEPAWRDMFFSYDEVNKNTGEYLIKGVSARVLQQMLWKLIPGDELQNAGSYYNLWKEAEGFDVSGTRVPKSAFLLNTLPSVIDHYNQDYSGAAQTIINQIYFPAVHNFQMFQRAFLSEGRKYWKLYNTKTFKLAFDQDPEWLSGLVPLLKRYYYGM